MQINDTDMIIDDAADTLRMRRFDFETPIDPDATSIYALSPTPVPARYLGSSPRRRRQIRDTRENVLRLREALDEGWDIAPELAHEQRRLATLEAAERK